jgi:L-ascorbate metabolism protein UlaG (beta-lactamase superfamily)
MIPIGGTFTMPPDTAREVLTQLKPKIAIPMHYREDLSLLGMFLKGMPHRRLPSNTLVVSKMALPAQTEIVVLAPYGGAYRRAD